MRKTFKYRLYPTKFQLHKMESILEVCKNIYNKTLELRKNAWEEKQENINLYSCHDYLKLWKEKDLSLYSIYSQILQDVQMRVDLAFKSFFRRCKSGETPGYPRFKSKGRYDSFTYTQKGFSIKNNKLKLSLIGNIKLTQHRPLEGKIKTLTIKKTSTGKWFATFSCELEDINIIQPIKNSIGIDLGLTTFATMSDGSKIERQRFFKQYEKRLANASRKREKLKKDSKARCKARIIESKIHEKLSNIRKDFAHKESLKLINKYDLICFEDLNIQKMQDTNMKTVKKGIADVAWNQFILFTQYKAEWAGKRVILIDPKNTTKECSRCGKIVDKKLSDRIHKCSCGLILDRDINAAINILRRGTASLAKA